MSVQFKHTFPGTECFGIDFSRNEKKPYFGASFTDGLVKIWSLTSLLGGATLDKPETIVQDAVSLGPVDFKFSPDCSKCATSSMDGVVRLFNLKETEESHGQFAPKTIQAAQAAENTITNSWKIDFSPDGSEILTGQTSLQQLKISDGLKASKEFATG